MKIGIVLPSTNDLSQLRELARFAEEIGVDSLWVQDGFSQDHPEAWTVMSALAASTERIEVGAYMLNASLRDMSLFASMAATLDRLAPGRIRIMFGTGWDRSDYEALGATFPSPDVRTARTRDAVAILKDRTWASVEVAGVTDDVLRIVADAADGWALSADALDVFFERVSFLRDACARGGRSFDDLRLSCTLPCVDDALDRMRDLDDHGMHEFRVALSDGNGARERLKQLVAEIRTRTRRFEVPKGPVLAYDDLGDRTGTPVVLLHGGGASREGWFNVVPHLEGKYRVLALDQRGHGASDRSPGDYRVDRYADDVVAFIEQVAEAPVALVGHSLGGLVAAHVAATRPDLVSRSFLGDPPLYGDGYGNGSNDGSNPFRTLQEFLRRLHDRDGTVEDVVERLRALPSPRGGGSIADELGEETTRRRAAGWYAADPDVFTPGREFLTGYDPSRPIPAPVHVVRADPDRGRCPMGACFRPEHEERFLATHPRATVELVEGAGHAIHLEQPDRFVAALEAFLDAP